DIVRALRATLRTGERGRIHRLLQLALPKVPLHGVHAEAGAAHQCGCTRPRQEQHVALDVPAQLREEGSHDDDTPDTWTVRESSSVALRNLGEGRFTSQQP